MAKVFSIGGNTISYGGFLLRELGNGSLTITKSVSGSGFDPTKTFEIVATFSAPVTYNGTTATTHTFNLADGQSVTITGIPELTEYEVTETPLSPQDMNAGYAIIGITGASGIMGKSGTLTATASNSYVRPASGKTIRIQFEDPTFDPTATGLNWASTVSWERYSSSPNIWDCTNDRIDWQTANFGKSWCADMGDFRVLQMNASGVENLGRMFFDANILSIANVVGTESVISTRYMFEGCSKLTSVALFDTSSVTDMSGMFWGCTTLTDVPLFNTQNVTDMGSMFGGCTALTDVPLFNTQSVTDMDFMFSDCSSLESVPLFDTSSLIKMNQMFLQCSSLKEIPLFETDNVTTVFHTFDGCVNVESGALSMYNQLANQATPPSNHSYCFTNCGVNTETGSWELLQIPSDWK